MPADSSIYQNRGPSLAEGVQRIYQMKELADQRKLREKKIADNEAIKEAYKKNLVDGKGGMKSLNKEGLVADLYKLNPEKAMQLQQSFKSQQRAEKKENLTDYMNKVNLAGQILGSAKDPESYQAARAQLISNDIMDEDELPFDYDPSLVSGYANRAMTMRDRLQKQWKERELEQKDRELGIKERGSGSGFNKALQSAKAKTFAENQANLKKTDSALNAVDDALKAQIEYSQSSLAGTGPFATLGGLTSAFNQETESLNAKLKAVNLKNMANTFAGMSKAIDSDAERAAWEGTQADISNDDSTNMKILLGQKSVLLKDKAEAAAQSEFVKQRGSLDGYVSPIDGQVKSMVDASGKMILVPNDKIEIAKKQGLMAVDEFAKKVVSLGGNRLKSKSQQSPTKKTIQQMALEEIERRKNARRNARGGF